MRTHASLRSRLLLAAVLWTAGLFLAGFLLFTFIMLHSPRYARITHGWAYRHAAATVAVSVVCMAAGLWLVRRGLSPLEQLRARLAAVHGGRARRVEGRYPAEVQPLVDDMNALLEHREQMVRRAQARAGDLAHGLKTPLAVLAHEAERMSASGHADLSGTIERMRRQIEYHLAQARAAASGAAGARCQVLESADALARTLERLYAARGLRLQVDVSPGHVVRAQREDLDEMLGNLLDNACKWARTRVQVASAARDGLVEITIDDDGAGIEPEMRERVLQRGVRADEAAPGSGLGLAIVRDLAELYGGTIALETSPLDGVRARLLLMAAD
ncbi:MAG TPA: sensor histidine kinase [Vicinamibacterales bacterium]|nr:sensor histidine kinase [Vicinamibacterales bacterium]